MGCCKRRVVGCDYDGVDCGAVGGRRDERVESDLDSGLCQHVGEVTYDACAYFQNLIFFAVVDVIDIKRVGGWDSCVACVPSFENDCEDFSESVIF